MGKTNLIIFSIPGTASSTLKVSLNNVWNILYVIISASYRFDILKKVTLTRGCPLHRVRGKVLGRSACVQVNRLHGWAGGVYGAQTKPTSCNIVGPTMLHDVAQKF